MEKKQHEVEFRPFAICSPSCSPFKKKDLQHTHLLYLNKETLE